jgi:hypothetical protein
VQDLMIKLLGNHLVVVPGLHAEAFSAFWKFHIYE